MPKRIDLTNQQFGELKVLRVSPDTQGFKAHPWECECSCGRITYVLTGSLLKGHYKSCGCKRVEKRDKGVAEHIKQDRVKGTRKSALTSKLHVNNSSGVKGVRFNQRRNKWTAHIGFRGKQINLGYYANFEDAVSARKAGEEKYHRPITEDTLEQKDSPPTT